MAKEAAVPKALGSASRRTVGPVRPFRSHRTLRVGTLTWVIAAVIFVAGLIATYEAMRIVWPAAMAAVLHLVAQSAVVTGTADRYIGISFETIVPQHPPLTVAGTLWVAGICVALLLITMLLPKNRTPLRYWVSANLLVLFGSAIYAFFHGRVGYSSEAFMMLVERTSLLVVVCAPIFGSLVAFLLPFSALERIGLVVLMVLVDAAFAVVRIGTFALLVARFGTLAEANLYLFLGPLMDVVYFIAVYSIFAVSLSERLVREREAWIWL
jgi:hypothetical protein